MQRTESGARMAAARHRAPMMLQGWPSLLSAGKGVDRAATPLFASSCSWKRRYAASVVRTGTLRGGATAEGTAAFRERLGSRLTFKQLPRSRWSVSPFGFGGYRVSVATRSHRSAMKKAIRLGCNVLDTSSIYSDGDSEILFGQAVKELVQKEDIKRDEVVIMTKAGFLSEGTESKRHSSPSYSADDVLPISPGLGYSLSPAVLEDQISESLQRLNVDKVDVLMLHNLEQILESHPKLRSSFYDMIAKAFEHLEMEVKRGRIQYYGVSSNNMQTAANGPGFVSLDKLTQIAQNLGAQNSFAAVQYPFNILEPEVLTQGVSDFAKGNGLMRFSNRPLNAVQENKLLRLATFPTHDDKDIAQLLKEAFDYSIHMEKNYPGVDNPSLPPAKHYAWAQILAHNQAQLNTIDRWVNALESTIMPQYEKAVAQLDEHAQLRNWGDKYRVAIARLFERFSWMAEAQASKGSLQLNQAVSATWPELEASGATALSQKALLLARSADVSDCVLVGMRRDIYVREVLLNVGAASDVDGAKDPARYSRFMAELHKARDTAS